MYTKWPSKLPPVEPHAAADDRQFAEPWDTLWQAQFQRLFGEGTSRRSRNDVRKNSGDILDDVFGSHADADRRRQARLDRRKLRRQQQDRQM